MEHTTQEQVEQQVTAWKELAVRAEKSFHRLWPALSVAEDIQTTKVRVESFDFSLLGKVTVFFSYYPVMSNGCAYNSTTFSLSHLWRDT